LLNFRHFLLLDLTHPRLRERRRPGHWIPRRRVAPPGNAKVQAAAVGQAVLDLLEGDFAVQFLVLGQGGGSAPYL
jgi:hypothetical protein